MNQLSKIILTLAILSLHQITGAQPPSINTTIDSTHIFIGQQTLLKIEIAADNKNPVQLPEINDTITTGVEILNISPIDTVSLGNNRIRLSYNCLITSFDSALYIIPPLKIVQNTDTVHSNPLALKVSTLPVDTESKQFFDIAGILKPKFVLWDYILTPLLIWLAALIAALLITVIYRVVKKKPLIPFRKIEPELPPHINAIQKLDEIRLKKLWQQGKIKTYHSEIVDTLREYLQKQFNINAPEMTSNEIIIATQNIEEITPHLNPLKQILSLADFVKFAKYSPLSDENELSIQNAYLFVENTKKEEINDANAQK
jgi:hypothetical protein